MAPVPHKGQLTSWKDDRGFGFIKPEGGGKEVFLHISALPRDCRRPQVGDTILYKKVTQPDGKVRAAQASIQGVVPSPLQTPTSISTTPRPKTAKSIPTTLRPQTARRQPKQDVWLQALVGILGLTTVALFAAPLVHRTFLLSPVASILPSPLAEPDTTAPPSPVEAFTEPTCMVKGNISISSGNKLYHVPGMEDYEGTEIHLDKGERWFCTEAEAIAAGWRRAPR
ncbi:cold shock domain-containing protein [Nodosilinea sp. FACHB-131]|nr:cold shock domain-containing protein [Nodosilinea sp. FACHB-131]